MGSIIFLDTETNNNREDKKILQLSFVEVDGEKMRKYDEKYQIDGGIDVEAMEIHGITPEDMSGLPKFGNTNALKILKQLNIPENYLIAHNASFDVEALKNEGIEIKMQVIDTLKILKVLYPDSERHRLAWFFYKHKLYKMTETIKKIVGHNKVSPHDALSDCAMLVLVFYSLIMKSCKTMDAIMEMMKAPYYEKYLTFGKYSRYKSDNPKTIEQITKADPDYVEYILGKFTDMIPEQRTSLEHWYNVFHNEPELFAED